MIDQTLQAAISVAVEKTISGALRYDPASQIAVTKLSGQVLAIELSNSIGLSNSDLVFYFFPCASGVKVQSYFEGEVTTRVKASALALATIANGKTMNLADSDVEVFGSTAMLIELQGILQNLEIDWEETLSDLIGDVSAHLVAQRIRGVSEWFGNSNTSIRRLASEYLTEELKVTPSQPELDRFYQDIDELRINTDRASAKIAALIAERLSATDNKNSH